MDVNKVSVDTGFAIIISLTDCKPEVTEIENNTQVHIGMEFLFQLNTRREVPYLQATMYYFVYHINTIALC